MPIALEPNLVGKRQDLQDMVYVADVKATPGLASIKKGEPLRNMLYDFEVKAYGSRQAGGVPDGADISAFNAQSPKAVMQARGEVFRRAPMVGFIAQKMSQAGGVAGTKDLYAEAKADQAKEHARDMEKELWSNQDSQPDTGTGSKFRGLGLWTNPSRTLTDTLTVPAIADIPTNQVLTTNLSDTTTGGAGLEDSWGAIIQAKYENTGASSDLRGFVTPKVKNKFGFFSRYQGNVTSFTSSVYITTGKLEGNTLFGPSVDVYKSDWGTFQLFPVLSDFTPSAYWALFIDMANPRIRSAGTDMYDDLPDLGGGPRGLLESIISIHPGDLRSYAKYDGAA